MGKEFGKMLYNFHFYFLLNSYLNGKEIIINNNETIKKNLELIYNSYLNNETNEMIPFMKLQTIVAKIILDLIPEDSVLLHENLLFKYEKNEVIKAIKSVINGEKLKEPPVKDISFFFTNYDYFCFYSNSLLSKNKCIKNLVSYSPNDLKIINKTDNFNIFEYPQKKALNYYTIIIIGSQEKNLRFINGFLNFLFDIHVEDNYRLRLSSFEKEKDYFMNQQFINSKKGNFAFICFNLNNLRNISEEEMENDLKVLNDYKQISLILFNDISLSENEKKSLMDILIKEDTKINNNIFFILPNEYFDLVEIIKAQIVFELYNDKNSSYIESNSIKNKEFEVQLFLLLKFIEKKEDIRNRYNYGLFMIESIFEEKTVDNPRNFCSYNTTMESYAKLYKIIIEKETKDVDLSLINQYLTFKKEKKFELEKEITKLYEKKKEMEIEMENKKKPIRNQISVNKEKIQNLNTSINNLEKKLKDEIKNINDDIYYYQSFEEKIKKNTYFLIPIRKKENIEYLDTKTNVCKTCRFNCHLNCNHYFKGLCQCFDWTFRCKVCPNKCHSDYHTIASFKYPIYEYLTIDNILKKYCQEEYLSMSSESSDLKFSFFIQKLNEKTRLLENQFENTKKEIEESIKKIENENEKMKMNTISLKGDRSIIIELNKKIEDYNDYPKKILLKIKNINGISNL